MAARLVVDERLGPSAVHDVGILEHRHDFDQAPSWQIFRQFASFRKLEPEIRSYLRKEQINPDILSLMGVRDFSDLIFRAFKKDDKQTKVFFSENGTPRNNYVKALAHKFGNRIADILRAESLDERYIRSLLNAMKMFGKTDAEKLIIMEINFTPRVLSDLKQAMKRCRRSHTTWGTFSLQPGA